MRLSDLLRTLPGNTELVVWTLPDNKRTRGTMGFFLSQCFYRHLVVKSVIPGDILTVGCRPAKKRRVKHARHLPVVAAKLAPVVSIRRGVKRHAPAGMFLLSDGQMMLLSPKYRAEYQEYCWSHAPELDPQDLADTDIYRQILSRGGIQPRPGTGASTGMMYR